jgi:hypothetical protein
VSPDFADFAEMLAEARANYARTIAAARRPDATREEITAGLDLIVCRRIAQRAIELCDLPLSRAERRAAIAVYSDTLSRQQTADLAALFDEG